jgi:hypothetical protein
MEKGLAKTYAWPCFFNCQPGKATILLFVCNSQTGDPAPWLKLNSSPEFTASTPPHSPNGEYSPQIEALCTTPLCPFTTMYTRLCTHPKAKQSQLWSTVQSTSHVYDVLVGVPSCQHMPYALSNCSCMLCFLLV